MKNFCSNHQRTTSRCQPVLFRSSEPLDVVLDLLARLLVCVVKSVCVEITVAFSWFGVVVKLAGANCRWKCKRIWLTK